MTILKHLSKISTAVAAISLLSTLGAKASEISFDGGSRGGSVSVAELRDQAKSNTGDRVPVPSTAPASNELTHFWDNLRTDGLMEKACKAAQIKLNKDFTLVNTVGLGGGVKRLLKQYPDKRLALIDEIDVKLSATLGTQLLNVPAITAGGVPVSLGVAVSGGVEGRSIVVRPLEDNRYCKQLTTLIKLYEMKTVLPINTKRISAMQNGEIWKLPVVVRYGISGGVGATFDGVSISIGAGYGKERKPSVSLYRIDENNLRLRLRIDHITVKSVGVNVNTVEIPAGDIGLLKGEDLISKTVNRTVASEINKMIAFKLAYSHVRTSGQKLLLEFYVNPNNTAQVEQLVQFLQGDFDSIRKFIEMGLKFDTFAEAADGKTGEGELEQLADNTGSMISSTATFTGSDHYNGHSDNFGITIPIIHSHQKTWASTYHRYQSIQSGGATVHVQQETRVSNGDTMNLPFVGTQARHNSQKDVYVVNKESVNGDVSKPVLLYQQYEGLIGHGDYRSREMLDNANNVLKYAGMKGDGTTNENVLPSNVLFPPLPPVEHNYNDGANQSDPTKTYKAAVMSFKLVFSEKAVQDIITAAPDMIVKCFMNVMRETESAIIDKVMDLFTINKKGKVDYNQSEVAKRLGVSNSNNTAEGATNPLDIVRTLAYSATKFLEKMVSVKEETGWKAQSDRLAKVASSGDMKYEDFLKVVIQMVDTKDISSSILLQTDKRVKGEPDVNQNYTMFNNRDNGFDQTIADVTSMRERFSEPTDLTD